MTDEPQKIQWVPLVCPGCHRSAYDIDAARSMSSMTIVPDMLRRTDEKALSPEIGTALQCCYCGDSLALAKFFPVVGGGWEVRFQWISLASETR